MFAASVCVEKLQFRDEGKMARSTYLLSSWVPIQGDRVACNATRQAIGKIRERKKKKERKRLKGENERWKARRMES